MHRNMVIYISLLAALIGLLMYVLAANPKVQELGRILFFSGTLAFLLQLPARLTEVLPK